MHLSGLTWAKRRSQVLELDRFLISVSRILREIERFFSFIFLFEIVVHLASHKYNPFEAPEIREHKS